MTRAPLVLTLEVDASAEPIRGTLSQPGEPRRSFDGWLGLTRALHDVVDEARRAAAQHAGRWPDQAPGGDGT